jgi:heme-binding NEAT domain protein
MNDAPSIYGSTNPSSPTPGTQQHAQKTETGTKRGQEEQIIDATYTKEIANITIMKFCATT